MPYIRRLAVLVLFAVTATACGSSQSGSSHPAASVAQAAATGAPVPHPQAIQPVAGAAARVTGGAAGPASVSVGAPSQATSSLPQPASIDEIRQDLSKSGISADPNRAALTPGGLAIAPLDAPAAVQAVIAAGNEIARLPYVWGGGHTTYEDTGYDCSGSISYVFAAAGLLDHTVTSGSLENWGDPGPGKWITIFANAGHTFMYVAGLRFDTVALAETGSRWSNRSADEPDLRTFAVRHPPGL